MRYAMGVLALMLVAGTTTSEPAGSLPKPEDVFVIASSPELAGGRPYFTPESLLKALPSMRPGEAELKVGAKRVWQHGVIVLKDKKVLFWLRTEKGVASFIIGDGRDNL